MQQEVECESGGGPVGGVGRLLCLVLICIASQPAAAALLAGRDGPRDRPSKAAFEDPFLPPGYLDFDAANYHVFSLSIRGTRVVVAIHRSLDGVTQIGGRPTPTREEFAGHMFKVFEVYSQIFSSFPLDRVVIKVQALADPQRFLGASRMGFVLSAADVDLAGGTGPPHWYTIPMYREAPAHELFHIWNGGVIQLDPTGRTDSPGPFFEESWFVEGLTGYYDPRSRQAAGYPEDYARGMQVARDNYFRRVGTEFDLPFAGLAARASTGCCPPPASDFQSMFVWKGALVGYLLDWMLLETGKTLDDLMRYMYEQLGLQNRRFRTRDVIQALRQVSGRDFQDFFDRYVVGNERLPVEGLEFLEHHPSSTRASIATDGSRYRAGQGLTVSLAAGNPGGARGGGAHLGAQPADGRTTLYFTGRGFVPTMTPLARAFPLASGAVLGPVPVFSFALPASIPAGAYTFLLTLTDPGNPGAIVASASVPITFQP